MESTPVSGRRRTLYTMEQELALAFVGNDAMRTLESSWASAPGPTVVYDAATTGRILGLPTPCHDPVPPAHEGEVVIYYGGWDLKALCLSKAGQQWMSYHNNVVWYEKYGWKAEPGYYRLLVPVPSTHRQKWVRQLKTLAAVGKAWTPSPICVAATAMLAHLMATGEDLLDSDWCRCGDSFEEGTRHAALLVSPERRLEVHAFWHLDSFGTDTLSRYANRHLWLAAAQKI